MRLFTAVRFEARVRDAVAAAFAHLRTERALGRAAVKWVVPSNFHLTLQFLGEVSPHAGAVLVNAFASTLSHSPFHVSFGPGGTFPPRGQPRVICIGVQEGAVQLASVRREVQTRLTPLGYPAGDQVYHPHLTVGRVRRGVSMRRASLVEPLATGRPVRPVARGPGPAVREPPKDRRALLSCARRDAPRRPRFRWPRLFRPHLPLA